MLYIFVSFVLIHFRIRAYNYLFFICVLAGSLLFSARLSDSSFNSTPVYWKLFDAWIIIMTLWFVCDEISEFKRYVSTFLHTREDKTQELVAAICSSDKIMYC